MAGEDGLAEGVSGFGVEVAGVVVFGASDFGAAELGLAEGDFDALLLAEAEAFALELAFALGFVLLEELVFELDFDVDADVAFEDGLESSLFTTGASLLSAELFALSTSSVRDLSSSKSGASL